MKIHRAFWLMAFCLLLAHPVLAQRNDCAVGTGLGSSLLFPYLEYDPSVTDGRTTLLSINNGAPQATLARAVLWTDWGLPTLAFDIYLGAHDIVTINVRDLFNGIIPSTGAGADLSGFINCLGTPPTHPNPWLSTDSQTQLLRDHTGSAGPFSLDCAGENHGDGVARGYMTVDVTSTCVGIEAYNPETTPARAGYFGGGFAIETNRLWGDVFYVDPPNNFASGNEAISLWADPAQTTGPNTFSFYARFVGNSGADHRAPLPRRWRTRFLNGGPFAGGASLIVHHQPLTSPSRRACGTGTPAPLPLGGGITARDENASAPTTLATTPLRLVTQRFDITDLAIPYNFGQLDLQSANGQLWVQPVLSAAGLYSASTNATPVEFLCGVPPVP